MKKNIISKSISIIMALMIPVLTVSTAFAAMPNGTVVIGSKAFDLAYANDPANITEITNAIVDGGAVYVKNFNGSWVENNTGLTVTVNDIPAVVYKNTTGVSTNFNAGDKDIVPTPTPSSGSSGSGSGGSGGGYSPSEVKSTPMVNAAIAATTVNSGQTLEHSTLSGTFKNTSNVAVTGILAWDIPATTVTTTGSFAWTFTPTDITTYNVVKGNVSVSVVDMVSAINAISGTAQVGSILTAGTLTPASATVSYQWKICDILDGTYVNITGATTNKYTPVPGDVAKFIKVSATGTGSYAGTVISAATAKVGNTAQLAPTETLAGVAPTSYGFSDGKITGTTNLMEYKLSTASTYTAATGAEATGLAAGTYNVRYAAKTGFNAGATVDVVVAVGANAAQAAATTPSSITLAVGSTNPVGSVTDVAIPVAGGTDSTGVVQNWSFMNADRIKFSVTDSGSASSSIQINSASYTNGGDYVLSTSTSPVTIVVTTTETGKTPVIRTFNISVAENSVQATAPSAINLAVGSTNPVGGVMDVNMPEPGGTDATGRVTGWVADSNDMIKFTVTDSASASSMIQINNVNYTSGVGYTIPSESTTLTVVVVTIEMGKATVVRNFTITVSPLATSPLASFTAVTLTQTGDVANSNVQYANAAAVIEALPTTIAVTLVDASVVNVPVTWSDTDTYNAAVAANYTFTATWGAMPALADNTGDLAVPTVEVTVTATPSTIIFTDAAPSKVFGSGAYTNVVSGNGTGAITYSSETPATATVDASTGAITMVAPGTTIITAVKAATATHATVTATYTLTVTAVTHKGVLDNLGTSVSLEGTLNIALADLDLATLATPTVKVTSSTDTIGQNVTLTWNSGTSKFEGAIIVSASAGDGKVQATSNDTITVTYHDAADASGNAADISKFTLATLLVGTIIGETDFGIGDIVITFNDRTTTGNDVLYLKGLYSDVIINATGLTVTVTNGLESTASLSGFNVGNNNGNQPPILITLTRPGHSSKSFNFTVIGAGGVNLK